MASCLMLIGGRRGWGIGGGGTRETQKLIPSKTGEELFLPSVFRQSSVNLTAA